MKKGQTLSGKVIRVDFPNRGIVETDTGLCVVKNTLPGQEVTFTVSKARKNKAIAGQNAVEKEISGEKKITAEGRLISIDKISPLELPSPCPHFGECGGCIMQSLPYDEQLQLKAEQLKRLLAIENFEGIRPSPKQFGYRNKMEFSFGDEYKGGPLALGMHRRASFYDVVSVDECCLVDEDFSQVLKFSRDYFSRGYIPNLSPVDNQLEEGRKTERRKTSDADETAPITNQEISSNAIERYTYYHRIRHSGYLRHLLVRKAARTEEILIALVTTSQENHNLSAWKDGLLNLPLTGIVKGILHIKNDSVADIVRADEIKTLYGQKWFYEEILGLCFKITPFSFFQTNSLGAEVLYETVRELVGEFKIEKPIIYDLYCGTGTISQLMAPIALKVIGVDIVAEAIAAARESAVANSLHNCEFIGGDVLKVLDEIAEKPDFIILDPPRDGLHPKALKKIIAYQIPRLLYISCKPTSLARDLKEFFASGYYVSRAVAVDLFPATGNVEVVCLLVAENRKC